MSKLSPFTMAEVASQFAEWRQNRTNLQTPVKLKEQAVGLLSAHSIGAVCKGLGVNHEMVKRWRRELGRESAVTAFVALPEAEAPGGEVSPAEAGVNLTLSCQWRDGRVVTLSGQLSAEQWRWALGLVAEEGL